MILFLFLLFHLPLLFSSNYRLAPENMCLHSQAAILHILCRLNDGMFWNRRQQHLMRLQWCASEIFKIETMCSTYRMQSGNLLLSSTFGSASPFRLHPRLFRCPVSDLMCSCCRIFTYWSENGCVDNYKLGYYEMHIFHWPQLKINHFLNGIYIDKRERRALQSTRVRYFPHSLTIVSFSVALQKMVRVSGGHTAHLYIEAAS